jgi:hypothetical protein
LPVAKEHSQHEIFGGNALRGRDFNRCIALQTVPTGAMNLASINDC